MTSGDDVKKLAALARIALTDEEVERFSKEFDSILEYASQVEKLKGSKDIGSLSDTCNVFRDDADPHEKGKHTKAVTEQFRDKEGNALKVTQIISYE